MKLLIKFGIGLALLLMVCELTYINTLSLMYLVRKLGDVHLMFSVIGSLAYSIVTVIVMSTTEKKWPKALFPIFDTFLVFCGFNLEYYNSIIAGTDNEVRFFLTIVLALFTGLITFCLGIINYEKHMKSNTVKDDSKITELVRELDKTKNDFFELKREFVKKESELNSAKSIASDYLSEISKTDSELKAIKGELKDTLTQLNEYRKSHLKAERSRILKKNAANRTPDELAILKETN